MKNLTKSRRWLPISLLILDWLLFSVTNPRNVPSWLIIVAFLMVSATLYYATKAILYAVGWYGLQVAQPRRLAAIVTGLLAILIAFQSVGQLSQRDILVGLPLMVLAYLYFSYGRSPETPKQS